VLHKHHRKRRSQGGDDSPVNTITIPSALHDWIHANPEKAYDLGLLVKSYDDPAEISVTLPEEFIKISKKLQGKEDPEKPRVRTTWSVKVPKDSEDGVDAIETLLEAARSKLKDALGWKDDVPNYFVLVAVLHDWVSGQGE
jgi:hypothetical protein